MLQNARVTAFTVSELLRENQQGGGGKIPELKSSNKEVFTCKVSKRSTGTRPSFHDNIET